MGNSLLSKVCIKQNTDIEILNKIDCVCQNLIGCFPQMPEGRATEIYKDVF